MTRAFSLVETVVVIALGTVLLAAITFMILAFNEAVARQEAAVQSSGSASALMREIASLTLPANAVLETHSFSGSIYASSPTVLVLEIPSLDNSGNVIAGTHDYAAFYTAGTNAYRILEANPLSSRSSGTKQLSATVSSLTFTYAADFAQTDSIIVEVQTEAQMKDRVSSDRRREQIRLRNY